MPKSFRPVRPLLFRIFSTFSHIVSLQQFFRMWFFVSWCGTSQFNGTSVDPLDARVWVVGDFISLLCTIWTASTASALSGDETKKKRQKTPYVWQSTHTNCCGAVIFGETLDLCTRTGYAIWQLRQIWSIAISTAGKKTPEERASANGFAWIQTTLFLYFVRR